MQAIILAAGMGKRLGEYTKNNTKCMVKVNGTSLIDRVMRQLSVLPLKRVVIVVGYEGKKLMSYLGKKQNGLMIEYINNPIYDKTNNIYSLFLAKEKLQEDDTILMESDLIFEEGMLNLLINNPNPNIALVAKYESWMDGTMVRLDEENNILNFIPKKAFKYDDAKDYYKTVNIYKLSKEFLRDKYVPFLEAYSKAEGNNEYYENVLRIISFLNSHELRALPIGDMKWYEIDDKQDLDIAEAIFAEDKDLLTKYYGRYGGFWRFPQMLDFCYLVNPFFPSQKLLDEMQANFRTLLTEYPSGLKVNSLLASKCWGIREEYIIPGNGAAELIKALMENLEGKLGIIRPTFEEYPNRLPQDRLVAFIPQNEDFRYGIDDLISFFEDKEIATLLLINPDNPSGNFIEKEDVLKLAHWSEKKGLCLIVDESFVDFSKGWNHSSLLDDSILKAYPHLVVMKSISKSYGVPGLRLGIMASSDKDLIMKMKKRVSIWNLNSFAEFFMQIYEKHENDYKKACEKFQEVRSLFEKGLNSIPYLHVMPSQANFFFCKVLPPYTAKEIVMQMLKHHNILMSACIAKKGIEENRYMRIAVRSRADNDRLLEALRTIII
ncbi:MAG: aminotransferase class I/II-fold pyridoxal phosphate-dependent enzyme [Bacteroidaceae bacterium]|nr:aminotransferase class I/II-fold pyridoxal phosphate-dependent enzyme [Bacteroidaceae bacterium]